jgi:hypothetical protein
MSTQNFDVTVTVRLWANSQADALTIIEKRLTPHGAKDEAGAMVIESNVSRSPKQR